MNRRVICLFLVLVLTVFTLSGCGNTNLRTQFYRKFVIDPMANAEQNLTYLTGRAGEVCILTGEEGFDDSYVSAAYAGVFCEDDLTILYAKNAVSKMYPASITKCMTALLVLESSLKLTDKITVGQEITEISGASSSAGLVDGYTYTVEDLLKGLLVPSGNDAANALAVAVSGSTEAFVELMNVRAAELGMVNTHFANPNGLHDKNHYTSVYDLYLLLRECMKEPDFLMISSMKTATITMIAPDGAKGNLTYTSGNSFLRGYTEVPEGVHITGAKTGFTNQAGRCLVLTILSDSGKSYMAVIGGANTYDALYQEMHSLLSLIPEYEAMQEDVNE